MPIPIDTALSFVQYTHISPPPHTENPINNTDYEARQAARAFTAKQLQAAHPHLIPVSDKNNSLVAAGKNMRIELAAAFPGVKFSVRSSRFSGGDSIDVTWTDGPTGDQVDSIVGKYSAGSFDGMTDCYNYEHSAWCDAFGDAKYVHSTREFSDRLLGSALARVAKYWGAEPAPTVDDYRAGRLWNVKANCSDFQREFWHALSRHTCCVGHAAETLKEAA
jgi:Large polyvalent protein associated domain 29